MEIIMLTDYKGFFRQHISDKISMDKEKIKRTLNDNGYSVTEYRYEEVANENVLLKDKMILYTSSQKFRYKNYIDDLMYSLSKSNMLIPQYDIFKSHENKGYQEIFKRELGINSLKFRYYSNETSLLNESSINMNYPLIVKKIDGDSSRNVFLVNSYQELKKLVRKINKKFLYENFNLKKYIRDHIILKRPQDVDELCGQFILQEFVEDLESDWKVLVFGDKFYTLNRKVRENDFRASGSGKLSYKEPSEDILNYSNEIFKAMNTPFLSLDIAYKNGQCYLIEFQGTHFGPYTILNSDFYYTKNNQSWEKVVRKSDYEYEYAMSIVKYLKKRGQ